MLNTFFTYLDVRARLSISDLRLSSDRRTILIGRLPHLAMIPSPGEVSIRTNIIFTPMNHLKQLSQYEWFVSRTETPYRECRKIWTRFHSSEVRKRVVQVWELRDQMRWTSEKMKFISYITQSVPCKVNVACFARDTLCSYFDEPQKNEIYFLNKDVRTT